MTKVHKPGLGKYSKAATVTPQWLQEESAALSRRTPVSTGLLLELIDFAEKNESGSENQDRKCSIISSWLSRISHQPSVSFDKTTLTTVMDKYNKVKFDIFQRDDLLNSVFLEAALQNLMLPQTPESMVVDFGKDGKLWNKFMKLSESFPTPEACLEHLLKEEEEAQEEESEKEENQMTKNAVWPPKIQFEPNKGVVKIDVGSEMIVVVLSQFRTEENTNKYMNEIKSEPVEEEGLTTFVENVQSEITLDSLDTTEPSAMAVDPLEAGDTVETSGQGMEKSESIGSVPGALEKFVVSDSLAVTSDSLANSTAAVQETATDKLLDDVSMTAESGLAKTEHLSEVTGIVSSRVKNQGENDGVEGTDEKMAEETEKLTSDTTIKEQSEETPQIRAGTSKTIEAKTVTELTQGELSETQSTVSETTPIVAEESQVTGGMTGVKVTVLQDVAETEAEAAVEADNLSESVMNTKGISEAIVGEGGVKVTMSEVKEEDTIKVKEKNMPTIEAEAEIVSTDQMVEGAIIMETDPVQESADTAVASEDMDVDQTPTEATAKSGDIQMTSEDVFDCLRSDQ